MFEQHPTLPPLDVAPRAERVRSRFAAAEVEALLVTDLTNVRWLTGFTGSAGRALVLPDRIVLVVDGRYGDQAAAQLAVHGVDATVLVGRTQPELVELVAGHVSSIGRLGLEAEHVSWAERDRLAGALAPELAATTRLVEAERRTKDDGELARIAHAAAIAGEALVAVLPLLDDGPTEREFALALDDRMRALGAEGPSFDTIVAAGPNAALPHHRPDDRRICQSDSVICDFGALYEGYHSDMTRTALLGEVDPWLREAYAAVEIAQAAGVAAVRPGLPGEELDRVCRRSLTDAGLGAWFTHGTGHGVGLLIHETPWATASSQDVLAERDVVTVEPGVYRGALGGIRIEDTVVVTADGCQPLTHTPKDLSCLRSAPTTSRPG
ncbi:MAG: M24 family metallopeptidase [Acidimicrobiia bacterium]